MNEADISVFSKLRSYEQYEVSVTVYMGRIANQRKVPKWLPLKNLYVRITKYLTCIYYGRIGILILNMKFLCVTLWLEDVYTDDDDTNANDDNAQSMIVKGS